MKTSVKTEARGAYLSSGLNSVGVFPSDHSHLSLGDNGSARQISVGPEKRDAQMPKVPVVVNLPPNNINLIR